MRAAPLNSVNLLRAFYFCGLHHLAPHRQFRLDHGGESLGCFRLGCRRVLFLLKQGSRFRQDQPQYNPSMAVPLPYPTNDSLEVNRWASYLCERMFKPGYQYKKAGIMLSEISPVTHRQGDLLEPVALANDKLMLALDTLNQRFGRGKVKVSTQGAYKQLQMKLERKSPHYTTDWYSIPMV